MSRVRVSVQPSNFFYAKNFQILGGNLAASATVYFKGQRPAIVTSGAARHGWLASNSDTATAMCVGCAGVRVREHVRACTRSCVREVFAIYDNTI